MAIEIYLYNMYTYDVYVQYIYSLQFAACWTLVSKNLVEDFTNIYCVQPYQREFRPAEQTGVLVRSLVTSATAAITGAWWCVWRMYPLVI